MESSFFLKLGTGMEWSKIIRSVEEVRHKDTKANK
jgi:hypothetical protein